MKRPNTGASVPADEVIGIKFDYSFVRAYDILKQAIVQFCDRYIFIIYIIQ